MKKIITVVTILLFSSSLWADFEVKQVGGDGNFVALKGDVSEVDEGDKVKVYFEDQGFCDANVAKISRGKGVIVVDSSKCKRKQELKVGLKAEVDLIGSVAEKKASKKEESGLPSLNESWYAYWGIGAAVIDYSGGNIDSGIRPLEGQGYESMSLAMDLFGFYWPLSNKKTILGFVINSVGDGYYRDDNMDMVMILQHTYGFSTQHFFGLNVGSGFFLRWDIGPAKFSSELSGTTSDVHWGSGVLFGGGYAIPVSNEARMLLNLNVSIRNMGDYKFTTTSFTVGLLF